MLRKIKLYSKLADFVGHKEFDAVCKNPAEAIRFLICNFPEVEKHMAKQNYKVLISGNGGDELFSGYYSHHMSYLVSTEKEKLFNKFPKQLSGGERQRVVIAAAISLSPKILICDECVSALDSSTRFSILNLLTDLKNNLNFSLIFISHNLPVVKSISDKIIVLKNGKIIENKLNSNLIKSKNEYVKKLLKSSFQ